MSVPCFMEEEIIQVDSNSNMQNNTTTLPPPKRAIAEVLLSLIMGDEVKESRYRFNGFRDAISQLKNYYKLPLRHIDVDGKNKFGRPCKYRKHFILRMHVKKAKAIYLKINP
jgi:hypothetical protein